MAKIDKIIQKFNKAKNAIKTIKGISSKIEAIGYQSAIDELGEARKSAETLFQGICTIDDIPISINGFVGGKLNDIIEWRLRGTRNSLRIKNWYSLERQGNVDWDPLLTGDQSLPQTAYMAQLDRLADQLNKGELLLPDFYDAFIIQKLVEDGLRNSKELRK